MSSGEVGSDHPGTSFGQLLRQHRLAQGLTQDTLAERAGLSAHGIQKLERGTTRPYRDTAQRLSGALQLRGQLEVQFKSAAQPAPRRRTSAALDREPVRNNLPLQTTSFIGRDDDLVQIRQRLHEVRLLTITGPGGCGKTRIALEVARQIVDDFPGGAWLVDLAPLSDASLMWHLFATALEVREEPGCDAQQTVADYLRGRSLLVVLDNCEHLIDACAGAVDALLHAAPNLRVLATSRELLGIQGEAAWRVRSLTVADPDALSVGGLETVLASEAARLLVDRARLLDPQFEVTDGIVPAIAQICKRLDGIPLAIELAAARLVSLSIDDLAGRLDQCFRLLTGGYRTAVRRQQTLEATIDWSYELLSEREQALFRSLSVFAGGCSLEAAEAVGGATVGSEANVDDFLNQLVRKSMVVVDELHGAGPVRTRYRCLETLRQYAEQKLLLHAEAEAARNRHANWYISLADAARVGMESADYHQWCDRLDLELDNLRTALTWLAAQPAGDDRLLRLAGLLGRFWRDREHMQEGIEWLEAARQSVQPTPPASADHVRVLSWLGILYAYRLQFDRARALVQQAASEAALVGDLRLRSLALRHHALICFAESEYDAAGELLQQALEASRLADSKREIAWNLGALASNQVQQARDYGASTRLLEESIALGRDSGDPVPLVYSMLILGHIVASEGNTVRAREIAESALVIARRVDARDYIADLLVLIGDVSARQGDWEAADSQYLDALRFSMRAASRVRLAHAILKLAWLRGAQGDYDCAARLLGALSRVDHRGAGGLSREVGALVVDEQATIQASRAALGDGEFRAAWSDGESLALEQVSAELLAASPAD